LTMKRAQEAKARLANNDSSKRSKLRKVSLNRLEASIKQRLENGQILTEDQKYLAGLTQITHVFFYPETNDIVIAGPAEAVVVDPVGRPLGFNTGQCVLELQDLIVALRAYPPSGANVPFIGVSIDPTEQGLQQMQQAAIQAARSIRPNNRNRVATGNRIAASLRNALGLQTVTVRGISPKTHFAQVLVEADYRMKLIGIGLERPPAKIKSYVERANASMIAKNALQRWYFTPNYECVKVSEDELAMELVGEGVKLVGADELVQANGVRVAAGNGNRASKAFVDNFTKEYPNLARRSPVYAQMRNLIDLSIAAAFIQEQNYYDRAGWDMPIFGDEGKLPVERYETPKNVESAVNVVWKGLRLTTPIGGGVEIIPSRALESDRLLADTDAKLQSLHKELAPQVKKTTKWWWD